MLLVNCIEGIKHAYVIFLINKRIYAYPGNIWADADLLLIKPMGTTFSEI